MRTSLIGKALSSGRATAMGVYTLGMLGGVQLHQALGPEVERHRSLSVDAAA